MERPAWAKLLIGLFVLVPFGAGLWWYAKLDLHGRVGDLGDQVRAIGLERGGRFPTNEGIEAQVRAAAAELGLEVGEVRVRVAPLATNNAASVGPANELMARKLAEINASAQRRGGGELEGIMPPASKRATLQRRASVVTVQLRARGDKWLWSVDEPVESTFTLEGTPPPR